MKSTQIWIFVVMTGIISGIAGAEINIHVSPTGNDAHTGSAAQPLATVAAAQSKVRQLRIDTPEEAVRVVIHEGLYPLDAPLTLTPVDSGSYNAPVIYTAAPGEKPILSGGRIISGWEQDGKLWKCRIPEGIFPENAFNALWVNGEYRHRARTPNDGFYLTAGKVELPETPVGGKKEHPNGFLYNEGDFQPWKNIEDALVVVFHSWDVSYHRILSLDEAKKEVRFTTSPGWKFEHWGPKQRYYVENLFEALDAPGEWYLDRSTRTLYYYPMDGEDPATTIVIAPALQQLVLFEGDLESGNFVEHIELRGLSFMHTDYPLGAQGQNNAQAAYPVHAAVQANGARYCLIEGCEITDISNYALWFKNGCTRNRIVRNDMHHTGAGGIRLGDGSSAKDDHHVTAWNEVDNNWVHDGGLIFQAGVGVWIGRSSYNTISHNEINDLYYTGVSVGWSWGYAPSSANHNIIEYNHIHDIGKRLLSDMGGIYLLGLAPGTIMRNNHIHDIYSFIYGGWGIYPDEGSTDLLAENNVVYHTKTGGFHQHYGRENRIQNNIFALSEEYVLQRTREEEHISFFFERNIVYIDNGRLLGSNWKNKNFVMDRNCYWNTAGDFDFAGNSLEAWRAMGHDLHSIVADPKFVDPEHFDFRLQPDSPALALGFRPIDISTAGRYGWE